MTKEELKLSAKEAKLKACMTVIEYSFSDDDLRELYNKYAEQHNYETIFQMGDADDIFGTRSFTETIDLINFSNFNPNHEYIMCTIYGVTSSNSAKDFVWEETSADCLASFAINEDSEELFDYDDEILDYFLDWARLVNKDEDFLEFLQGNVFSDEPIRSDWDDIIEDNLEQFEDSIKTED